MTNPAPTTDEFVAVFAPARFRTTTFATLMATLPDLDEAIANSFTGQHRMAIDHIANAHLAVAVEVTASADTTFSRLEWFAGDNTIVECCHLDEQVITTTWPGGDGVLVARLALAIGFHEDAASTWQFADAVHRPRIPVSAAIVDAVRDGIVPIEVASLLGSVQAVVRMWSTLAGTGTPQMAYDSTIVHTDIGPWLLDPSDEPCLRRIDPIELWREVALAVEGFEDSTDEEELA